MKVESAAPKFRLGDVVVSRRIGLPVVGTVAGLLVPGWLLFSIAFHALCYHEAEFDRVLFPSIDWDLWNSLYPEWATRPVLEVSRPADAGDGSGPPGAMDRRVLYFYPEADLEPFGYP